MAEPGKLEVQVLLDHEHTIRAVDIRSTRPAVSGLLSGRTPAQALAMVGLVYQVCRRAQSAAAEAALAAAGEPLATCVPANQEAVVAIEVLQENLWRLLLDWPAVFCLPSAPEAFRRWYGELRDSAAGEASPASLLASFERDWLGTTAAEWLAIDSLDALHDWSRAADSPAAALCGRVVQIDSAGRPPLPAPLLEDYTAAAIQAGWADTIDAGFAAHPHRDGEPRETGTLCWHADAPLLREALAARPSRVLARLLARIRDTLMLLRGGGGQRVEACGDGAGNGLAVVRSARGLLLHQVRLESGRVANWQVVAPTEWNFHPAGSLVSGLLGLGFPEPHLCERWVRAQLVSLDPCVEYGIGIHHA